MKLLRLLCASVIVGVLWSPNVHAEASCGTIDPDWQPGTDNHTNYVLPIKLALGALTLVVDGIEAFQDVHGDEDEDLSEAGWHAEDACSEANTIVREELDLDGNCIQRKRGLEVQQAAGRCQLSVDIAEAALARREKAIRLQVQREEALRRRLEGQYAIGE